MQVGLTADNQKKHELSLETAILPQIANGLQQTESAFKQLVGGQNRFRKKSAGSGVNWSIMPGVKPKNQRKRNKSEYSTYRLRLTTRSTS